MVKNYNIKELRQFYEKHLKEEILPFWINNSLDSDFGGYYTCFSNESNSLLSTDKFTWSQGRMVWVFAKLSGMDIFTEKERKEFLNLAKSGVDFLMKHCLLQNGNCTFIMNRKGMPISYESDGKLDTSIYADCFVVLGLSKYVHYSKDRKVFSFAKELYKSIIKRIEDGNFSCEPYPIIKGFKTHGIPMILLNTSQELSEAMKELGDNERNEVEQRANYFMNEIIDNFVSEDDLIHEMISVDSGFTFDKLIGRYVNPGHTTEDIWFILHQCMKNGNLSRLKKLTDILKKTFQVGWDSEFGGYLLFADKSGGKPQGNYDGFENEKMVQKILTDWDNKLWWPHSEGLYSMLLAYKLTEDKEFYDIYKKIHEYTFATFPNKDKSIGEWIQIRDRKGEPIKKVVALPVKDPFHIIRNIVLIIDLLRD